MRRPRAPDWWGERDELADLGLRGRFDECAPHFLGSTPATGQSA